MCVVQVHNLEVFMKDYKAFLDLRSRVLAEALLIVAGTSGVLRVLYWTPLLRSKASGPLPHTSGRPAARSSTALLTSSRPACQNFRTMKPLSSSGRPVTAGRGISRFGSCEGSSKMFKSASVGMFLASASKA